MDMPDEFNNNLSVIMSIVNCTVFKQKQDKGLQSDQGKSPMSLSVYTTFVNFYVVVTGVRVILSIVS